MNKDKKDDITAALISKGLHTSIMSVKQIFLWKNWTISSNAISSIDAFIQQKMNCEEQILLST